jgi:alanine dehydrogenase
VSDDRSVLAGERPQTPIFLSEADIAGLVNFAGTVDLLDDAFAASAKGAVVNRPRQRIPLGGPTYHLMAAGWPERGVVGLKVYTTSAHGAPMHMMLHAADGSGLLAVMAAGQISGLRTGAISGLAARHMAPRPGPVGVIGAGFQATAQVRGVVAATGAEQVRVFSRDVAKREAFAQRMSAELGVDVVAADSVADVAAAPVLVTITNSREPVLTAADVNPGTLVIAAGNNSWMGAEIAPELFAKASVIVVDDLEQARLECGELMRACEQGLTTWGKVDTLADVVSGRTTGRVPDNEIGIYESQGTAMLDLAVAAHIYRAAVDKGLGTPLA